MTLPIWKSNEDKYISITNPDNTLVLSHEISPIFNFLIREENIVFLKDRDLK